MVNQLWYRVSRKWSRLKPEQPHPRVFSECRYQDHVRPWYLVYRWLMFLAWALLIIFSVFEIGSEHPRGKNHLWAIYLTNWDLVLGLSQALLGALIVSRRWRLQKCSEFDPMSLTLRPLERIYWFLYVVTCSIAVSVTIIYWFAVYEPKLHAIDVLNILLHVVNSLLMILDLCIVRVPFFFISVWWTIVVGLLYVLFSIVYYCAGGVDKGGNHFIYPILNWEKPVRTFCVCLVVMCFLLLVHSVFCFLVRMTNRRENCEQSFDKTESSSTKNVDATV